MNPGDRIEYSITAQVRVGNADMWLKTGVNIAVQEGESTGKAYKRATKFVEDALNAKVEEVTGE